MSELVGYAPFGAVRRELAGVAAETAALAGWQALDLGKPKRCWELHQRGRSLALESEDAAVVAHVTAQQAYALLDVNKPDKAYAQITAIRETAASSVPAVLRAWLAAAHGEIAAASGRVDEARRSLDSATSALRGGGAETLSYLVLDEVHLDRWRGHCLVRVGDVEAKQHLERALAALGPTFKRATASLRVDLAEAFWRLGEFEQAEVHMEMARHAAACASSRRQEARLADISRRVRR